MSRSMKALFHINLLLFLVACLMLTGVLYTTIFIEAYAARDKKCSDVIPEDIVGDPKFTNTCERDGNCGYKTAVRPLVCKKSADGSKCECVEASCGKDLHDQYGSCEAHDCFDGDGGNLCVYVFNEDKTETINCECNGGRIDENSPDEPPSSSPTPQGNLLPPAKPNLPPQPRLPFSGGRDFGAGGSSLE